MFSKNTSLLSFAPMKTGKTHTMHGILMSAGKDLFGRNTTTTTTATATTTTRGGGDDTTIRPPPRSTMITVRISCMELYNEELRDLLCCITSSSSSSSSSSLPIQEDGRGNVKIPGLTERTVRNADELMEVVRITESNRTVGSTAMNERSSRGHTIFRITYERREAADADAAAGWLPGVGGGGGGDASVEEEGGGDEDKENDDARCDYHLRKGGGGGSTCRTRARSGRKVITTVSSLNLVDLAGSESVRVTGATGERQKEGGKINQRSVNIYIYIYTYHCRVAS